MRSAKGPLGRNWLESPRLWGLAAGIVLLLMVAATPSRGQETPGPPPSVLSDYALGEVEFRGRVNVELKEIEEKRGLKKGTRTDIFRVIESLETIRKLYRTKGYATAEINLVEGSNPGDARVVIEITEGPKTVPRRSESSKSADDDSILLASLFNRSTLPPKDLLEETFPKKNNDSPAEGDLRSRELPSTFHRAVPDGEGSDYARAIGEIDSERVMEYRAHREKALEARATGKWKKALSEVTAQIRLYPKLADLYVFRADIYESMKLHRRAINDLTEAMRLGRLGVQIYLTRGSYYCEDRDYEHGFADFATALELAVTDEDKANAHLWRGVAQKNRGEYALALVDFDRAIELGQDLADLFGRRGEVLAGLGEHDRALADFDRVLAIEPTTTRWFLRGESHFAKGQYSAAREDFERAIGLDPKSTWYHSGRGSARLALGEVDGAIEDFNQAINLSAKNYRAFTGRGWASLAKHDVDRAIADFDEAISLQAPGVIFADLYFSRSISLDSPYDRAVDEFNKMRRDCPSPRNALIVLSGDEARSQFLERPYFAGYLVCRAGPFAIAAPNLIFRIEADWRTFPEAKAAYLGRAIAAACSFQWQDALDNLESALKALVESRFPGSTRPPVSEFLRNH